ncbi:MAG: hypothetical protein WAN36_03545 [Calditrichia bacterium]
MLSIQIIVILVFVLIHIFAGKLRFLHGIPRSRWLSTAGGISVAYVFIHVLPELGRAQERLGEQFPALTFIEHHAYLVALLGLAVFYGLERMVKSSKAGEHSGAEKGETPVGTGIFWIHIISFSFYNSLIGYLLVHREEQDLRGLLFFSIAMALHFLITDYGLREDHQKTYRRVARWILAAAIICGWGLGLAVKVGEAFTAILFAFLAGGVILNVLKEELPAERQSRFFPFASGAALYAVLLLLL